MEVGKRYGVKWAAVERNIRTVARIAWERNRALLEEMVGCEFELAAFFVSICSGAHDEGIIFSDA